MFKQLAELARSTALLLQVKAEADGRLRVVVQPTPDKTDGTAALTRPLRLIATPEELDQDFAAALARFSSSYGSMKEAVDAAVAVTEAARQAANKKAAEAVKGKGQATKAAPPAAKAAAASVTQSDQEDGGDDSDADGGVTDVGGGEAQPTAATTKAPVTAPLF